jgi:phosphatidylglycerol---prolipoprotein diacylglyceryl transferase
MRPIWFIAGMGVSAWCVFVVLGFLTGLGVALLLSRRSGCRSKIVYLWCLVGWGATVGARLTGALKDGSPLLWDFSLLTESKHILGSIIVATVCVLLYIKLAALPVWKTVDVLTPAFFVALAIGRLRCFAAGCCYGQPTALPWGVSFSDPFTGVPFFLRHIPLHPTQFYEAALSAAIFTGTFYALRQRNLKDGYVALGGILAYCCGRLVLEAYRYHPEPPNGFLYFDQWLSGSICLVVLMFFMCRLLRVERVEFATAKLPTREPQN